MRRFICLLYLEAKMIVYKLNMVPTTPQTKISLDILISD